MSEDKGGLFDSDDEDDVQYNPDEGNDGHEILDHHAEIATHTSIKAPTDSYAPQNDYEEEKILTSSVPEPTPSKPVSKPVPKPTPASTVKPSDITPFVDESSDFIVSDPVSAGHISYTIKGKDEDGDFEGSRRYKNFFSLRKALLERWPGTYVPAIPGKKAVGNKDDKFIEFRRHFLQRFLRRIGQLPHLLNSDEFKLFARPSGEIEKMLAMMPRLNPDALVERFKHNLHVDEFPDEFLVKQCREVINDFNAFTKKIMPTLRAVKEQASKMVPVKQQQNLNYKTLIDSM